MSRLSDWLKDFLILARGKWERSDFDCVSVLGQAAIVRMALLGNYSLCSSDAALQLPLPFTKIHKRLVSLFILLTVFFFPVLFASLFVLFHMTIS